MVNVPKSFNKTQVINDDVSVKVNGQFYAGWKSVSITKNLTSLTGSFNLTVVDRWRQDAESWPLTPGNEIQIFIGQEKVMTGYIDNLNSSYK